MCVCVHVCTHVHAHACVCVVSIYMCVCMNVYLLIWRLCVCARACVYACSYWLPCWLKNWISPCVTFLDCVDTGLYAAIVPMFICFGMVLLPIYYGTSSIYHDLHKSTVRGMLLEPFFNTIDGAWGICRREYL